MLQHILPKGSGADHSGEVDDDFYPCQGGKEVIVVCHPHRRNPLSRTDVQAAQYIGVGQTPHENLADHPSSPGYQHCLHLSHSSLQV